MRGAGAWVVILLALVLLGALYLWVQSGGVSWLTPAVTGPAPEGSAGDEPVAEAKPEAKEPGAAKSPATGRRGVPRGEPESPAPAGTPVATAQTPSPASGVAPVAVVPGPKPRAFPTAGDIRVGMERPQLIASFMPPTLKTSTLRKGDLIEVFVYLPENNNSIATYVHLRNGKVVTAHTSVY